MVDEQSNTQEMDDDLILMQSSQQAKQIVNPSAQSNTQIPPINISAGMHDNFASENTPHNNKKDENCQASPKL